MAIRHTKLRGKVSLRGRPTDQAKAEIMVMRQQEKYEGRKRRRMLFTLLDIIIIVSFGLAIYSVYVSDYINAILFLIIGSLPLAYFIIRRTLRDKQRKKR